METIPHMAHSVEMLKRAANFNSYYTLPHVGDYKFSARTDDFHGWLKCDGRAVTIEAFPNLYDIVGTSFGNNGAGTFRLPNLKGRVPGAIGTSTAGNHPLGEAVGAETHVLTEAQMPVHSHAITDPGHFHGGDTYTAETQGVSFGGVSAADEPLSDGNTASATTGITINTAGSNQAHPIMQPTLFIGDMFIFGGVRTDRTDPIVVGGGD